MKKFSLLLAMASFLLFSGCTQQPQVTNPGLTDPHVRYESPRLHNWLKFNFINYIQRKDGLREFEAQFVNNSPYNKTLTYKVQWKNENGFVQKTLMSRWIRTEVEAKRSLVIHGISPNAKSSDFVILLQEPSRDDALRKDAYRNRYSN